MNRYEFYQWDSDVTVPIDEEVDEVHFASVGTSKAYVVGTANGTAPIPNILLQKPKDILCWYVRTDKSVKEIHITVRRKAKPDTYVYTPTEVKTVETMSQSMIDALEKEIEKVNSTLITDVTVETLEPSSPATASISNNTLALGIPKGDGANVTITKKSPYSNNLTIEKDGDNYKLDINGYTYSSYPKSVSLGGPANNSASGSYSVAEGHHDYYPGEKFNAKYSMFPKADKQAGVLVLTAENEPTATGQSSHAGGDSGNATGYASLAFGGFTNANGDFSTTLGYYNTALGFCETSIGQYNEELCAPYDPGRAYKKGDVVFFHDASGSQYYQADEDVEAGTETSYGASPRGNWTKIKISGKNDTKAGYLFTVGNGKSANERSNAMSVDWDGNLRTSGTINGVDITQLPTKEYIDEQLGAIANGSY